MKKYLLIVYKILFKLAGVLLPVNSKLIIFESFHGKQYSDNPRAIFEYINQNYPDYICYWSVNKHYAGVFDNYKDIKQVNRLSLKWLFLMNRANYWVTNSRLPLWITKPEKTVYLQTWHGTPLKRLAADMEEVHMPGTNTEKYKENFINEASKWDYLISPNNYSSEIFKRAFRFNKSLIESGYPRNDYLINSNNDKIIEKVKSNNNLPQDKKVILYAPTWRDNEFYDKGKYKFQLQLDLKRLQNEIGQDYIILLRMHYLVAEQLDLSEFNGFVYDFSSYEDIRDLYLISDVLITDYSSVFFDYANLKRPMIFYVYDLEIYRDKLRGFYFDFENEAPGPLVKTTDEVIDVIKNLDALEYEQSEEMNEFYNKFCYLEDGNASERVVEQVFR
jgi:CDP-glycerol glycerophosphotransferase